MIELTRLNGTCLVLNCDLIKIAEASPDTVLTLINGEKLIVKESLKDVEQRVVAYKARLVAASQGTPHPTPDWPSAQIPNPSTGATPANPPGEQNGLDAQVKACDGH